MWFAFIADTALCATLNAVSAPLVPDRATLQRENEVQGWNMVA